jgi:hypothetical protein
MVDAFIIVIWFFMNFAKISSSIDHGKSDELASGSNWKKIARFKRLESSSLQFQNDLAFLGRELESQVYPSFPRSMLRESILINFFLVKETIFPIFVVKFGCFIFKLNSKNLKTKKNQVW